MKRVLVLAITAMLVLAGCGSPAADEAGAVTITDQWVKATEEGAHMTGVFGKLSNNSRADIHVVAVTSDVTDRAELHEMVDQAGTPVMAEMPDGFIIPAGGTFELAPGGNHIMLMELMDIIEPGETVEFTLKFSDGATFTFKAEARVFTGANEEYQGDDGGGMSGGMGGHESPAEESPSR